mmetsp:Transcript_5313/g.9185  ORF Transcript_5313/g.9185 Transcript_5313/m.9185 type:complete len:230 (-) Transcript_5313:327-1016(-)
MRLHSVAHLQLQKVRHFESSWIVGPRPRRLVNDSKVDAPLARCLILQVVLQGQGDAREGQILPRDVFRCKQRCFQRLYPFRMCEGRSQPRPEKHICLPDGRDVKGGKRRVNDHLCRGFLSCLPDCTLSSTLSQFLIPRWHCPFAPARLYGPPAQEDLAFMLHNAPHDCAWIVVVDCSTLCRVDAHVSPFRVTSNACWLQHDQLHPRAADPAEVAFDSEQMSRRPLRRCC